MNNYLQYADALVLTVRKKKGKLHLLTSLIKAEI